MIDTREYYGGTYPEPTESKTKCYTFKCNCSCIGTISIYAESEEQAKEYLYNGDVDDCDYDNYIVENIIEKRVE